MIKIDMGDLVYSFFSTCIGAGISCDGHMYTHTHTYSSQRRITECNLVISHAVNIASIIIFPVVVVVLTRPGPGE